MLSIIPLYLEVLLRIFIERNIFNAIPKKKPDAAPIIRKIMRIVKKLVVRPKIIIVIMIVNMENKEIPLKFLNEILLENEAKIVCIINPKNDNR